ncbi:MAG TPA: transglycosylase domain-containing protein [Solirubrobacterales bacterium]|nr:transglycosylase domain-containing protein [Solirubrobacterales bacterium]
MAARRKEQPREGDAGQEARADDRDEAWSRSDGAFPRPDVSFPGTGEPDFAAADGDGDGNAAAAGAADSGNGAGIAADGAAADGSPAALRDRRTRRVEREVPARRGTSKPGDGNGLPPGGALPPPPPPPVVPPARTRPRLKKLRILFVLLGLGVLAIVSTVFGMMMAVAQDLPALENFAAFRANENTVVVDATGERIGTLTSNENRILLDSGEISPYVKNAVVSIEDSRFYEHRGVDFEGIGRALVQDVLSLSAKQGASTITQQFVKEALEAQSNRTVFQKLREAALAYHLERKWTKDEILVNYLNTVYFGQGAYGIEAAARTYFAKAHPGCGTETNPCASVLEPHEAALLAGVIQSPAAYDPEANPNDSKARRDLVLEKMLDQDYIDEPTYRDSVAKAIPAESDISPPKLDSKAPFFTSWMRQQLVDYFKAQGQSPGYAFFGGLKVTTTLDLELQQAAEDAVYSYLGGIGPTAAVVVIDNETGGVKAMVGGPDYEESSFNLATQGHRQPGSSIKPFILLTALQQGISPSTTYESAPQVFSFGEKGKEKFPVANFEDSYAGVADLYSATTNSDNSVYAQLGLETIKGGTRAIARTAHTLGVKTHLSTNPAMVLGGLERGVTPLEWAYAFANLNNEGRRTTGTFHPGYPNDFGPIGFTKIEDSDGNVKENVVDRDTVIDPDAAVTAKSMLESVVLEGTGTNAQYGGYAWGKTGTTENFGDAWFCGGVEDVTACVWVGYPDSVTPMTTEYGGTPVAGGTYPALIWARIIGAWSELRDIREAEEAADEEDSEDSSSETAAASSSDTYVPVESAPAPAPAATSPAPAPVESASAAPAPSPAPAPAPPPAPTPAPAPAPAPVAPATSGGTGGAVPPG